MPLQNNRIDQTIAPRRRFVIAFVSLLALFLFGLPFAAFSDDTLFEPVNESQRTTQDVPAGALRVRTVRVNWGALNPRTNELRLNLFDDVNLTAEFGRVDASVTGAYVWVGEVPGEPGSIATLAVQDGVLSGSVHRGGHEWVVIESAGGETSDLYTIREIDPDAPQPTAPDEIIPQLSATDGEFSSTQPASCQEDGSKISVLIAYTAEARDTAGGAAAIEALINRRISEMNTANDVSQVFFDWVLADVVQVDYVESGSILTDLERLQKKADGRMDGIHAVRDAVKADLVALLISEGSDGACGRAYRLPTLQSNFEDFAFGVTALDYADPYLCSEMTLTHELGHNLGNAHNRAESSSDEVVFPYSYGFQSLNKTFRTLMAYECPEGGCPRINQWANPALTYKGEPTGIDHAKDPANSSDMVRSMNQSRVLVSNFRADCAATPPPGPMTNFAYMPVAVRR